MSEPGKKTPLAELREHYLAPFRALRDFLWQRRVLLDHLREGPEAWPKESKRWKSPFRYAVRAGVYIGLAALILDKAVGWLMERYMPGSPGAGRALHPYDETLRWMVENAAEYFVFPAVVVLAGFVFQLFHRKTTFAALPARDIYFLYAPARLFWPGLAINLGSVVFSATPAPANAIQSILSGIAFLFWITTYTWMIIALTRYSGTLSEISARPNGNQAGPFYIGFTHFVANLLGTGLAILLLMALAYPVYLVRIYLEA